MREIVRPECLAIVALGPSSHDYIVAVEKAGGRHALYDQTWVVNSYGNVLDHDVVFHMDDVRVQEARAAADPTGKIAGMLKWMREHPGPILTSRKHPDYPGLVDYPLQDVINNAGSDYFNGTCAYALALAIAIGVPRFDLFGMDFNWAGASAVEPGRACVEYWIGRAQTRGIDVRISGQSSLMDVNVTDRPRYYGYDTMDVVVTPGEGGKVIVTKTPREAVPTAEEIERRYDHNPPAMAAE